ncbi:MAG: Bax inhibitor-1/YccA family protein [Candidatus Puniceispirillales bacterium]|jgi:FtsH-binding integral membrane protein|nr:Bax inhibitor-1/YccA family protein [Pseudomonadota bacterium]|tara:strand:+ start:140 stop:871 length:732 start_codon:yes stop_codon:yes gene_type:complete
MNNNRFMASANAQASQIDVGLRAYMLGVYNHMTTALAITGFFALGLSFLVGPSVYELTSFGQTLYGGPLKWVVMLAPLAMVFYISAKLNSISASKARNLFYIYSGLMGLSLSSLLLVYTNESVVRVFFITSAAFASLSIYGYTTKKNLSAFGSFLIMGVFGLIIASIVNIFLASSGLAFIISILGVLIFAGLTAYDTQKIKNMYLAGDDMEVSGKKSVMGALTLYLDFILMFQFLLMFLGNRE